MEKGRFPEPGRRLLCGSQFSRFTPAPDTSPDSQATSSHLATVQLDSPHPEAEEMKPILVTLNYVQSDTDTPTPPATRELQVGCIRTTQPSLKKVTTALAPSPHWPGPPCSCLSLALCRIFAADMGGESLVRVEK